MIDVARDLLAELQAAQARVEHLAQRALDDARAHDFLKRHGRWRQDPMTDLMAEIGNLDVRQFDRIRACLAGEDPNKEVFVKKTEANTNMRLLVPTLPPPNQEKSKELDRIFDTEIPPPLTNPMDLFIDEDEADSKEAEGLPSDTESKSITNPTSTQALAAAIPVFSNEKVPEEEKDNKGHDSSEELLGAIQKSIPSQAGTEMESLGDRIDKSPHEAENWMKRAALRELQGDSVGAISDYLRAANRQPESIDALSKLLEIYQSNGLSVKARQTQEKIDAFKER